MAYALLLATTTPLRIGAMNPLFWFEHCNTALHALLLLRVYVYICSLALPYFSFVFSLIGTAGQTCVC
jgi:uncharacterized RDD family membrane protein YckC